MKISFTINILLLWTFPLRNKIVKGQEQKRPAVIATTGRGKCSQERLHTNIVCFQDPSWPIR